MEIIIRNKHFCESKTTSGWN